MNKEILRKIAKERQQEMNLDKFLFCTVQNNFRNNLIDEMSKQVVNKAILIRDSYDCFGISHHVPIVIKNGMVSLKVIEDFEVKNIGLVKLHGNNKLLSSSDSKKPIAHRLEFYNREIKFFKAIYDNRIEVAKTLIKVIEDLDFDYGFNQTLPNLYKACHYVLLNEKIQNKDTKDGKKNKL